MFGLTGAHRVGKSTLAKEFAEKKHWKFIPTNVSAMFKELGHSPSESFDFKTRLSIQEQILFKLNIFYGKVESPTVITDRTPLDLAAYTMAEAIGNAVSAEDQERFIQYIENCFVTTNRWFANVMVVQPGIPIIDAEGKAAPNLAYMEHLNMLILGLCNDRRLKIPHFYIPRGRVEMEKRIESVEYCLDHTNRLVEQELMNAGGVSFH